MKQTLLFSCLTLALGLSACSEKPAPLHIQTAEEKRAETLANSEANRQLQEKLSQSRSNGLANVTTNAATYVAGNPRYTPADQWKVIPHADDYVQDDCLSGSGWGWANVMNASQRDEKGDPVKVKLICSTHSPDLGCYKESDFNTSPHAAKAKRCDKTLPFPIKRIG